MPRLMLRKFIFKGIEYLRASEIKDTWCFATEDAATAAVVNSLGGADELVKTGRVCFFAGCRIEDFALVAHLEPAGVTFPPVLPRQPYTRTDVCIQYQPDTELWVAAEASQAKYDYHSESHC